MKRFLMLLCLLAVPVLSFAQVSKKGDIIVGAGWGYNVSKDDSSDQIDGAVLSVEAFLSDTLSIRADYFRVEIAEEKAVIVPGPETWGTPAPVPTFETFIESSESRGLGLTLAPHRGTLSFPIGLLAVNDSDRVTYGGTAGVGVDFWASRHLGLNFLGSYQYLQNSTLAEDFFNFSGQVRLRF